MQSSNTKKNLDNSTSSTYRREEIDQGGTSGRPTAEEINDHEQTIHALVVERKDTGRKIAESKSKTMNGDKCFYFLVKKLLFLEKNIF